MKPEKPISLGITLGDINGIGPEVATKAMQDTDWPADLRFVVFDDNKPAAYPGEIRSDAAKAAARWIQQGVQACMDGDLQGLVTAPLSKKGLAKAGIQYPGHTEMLAAWSGTKKFAMMLMGNGLRVALATRHLPLKKVPESLTQENIIITSELIANALPDLGAPEARLAICGLNPHAGEEGLLGDEEQNIILPAVQTLKEKGYHVEGPLPADTVFYQTINGRYDAVVAMYHDQGLAPLKMRAFETGVNVTLGLPFVRTSPDHGTAYDLAGKNCANATSMKTAIQIAYECAKKKTR